jgi:hypothetical protein
MEIEKNSEFIPKIVMCMQPLRHEPLSRRIVQLRGWNEVFLCKTIHTRNHITNAIRFGNLLFWDGKQKIYGLSFRVSNNAHR